MVLINSVVQAWITAIGGNDTLFFIMSFGFAFTFIYIFYKIAT